MPTGKAIIERALRLLNNLGTGESVDATAQTDLLAALNAMFDSWNTERNLIFHVARSEFTLTANKNPHTIGSGGDISTARPVKIESASIIESNLEYPLEIWDRDRYQVETAKLTTSTIPLALWYESAFPLGKVHLWPVPSLANKIALYLWTALTTAMTWAASVSFPPGYEDAIVYNLAVRIAPEVGRSITPEIAEVARVALANIRSLNIRPYYMTPDIGVPGVYDIRANRYR